MAKLIVVTGATGGQGGSVVATFLKDGSFKVRGVTRNPEGDKAKALTAKGVEMVYADMDNEQSLVDVFSGAYTIFAVTDFPELLSKFGPELAVEAEYRQATNLAKAASKTAGLHHYLWSTLPNGRELTQGKIIVPHFDAKNRAEAFIKQDKVLLAKTTFLLVAHYESNVFYPPFTPIYVKSANKYIQLSPADPSIPYPTLGDLHTNVGIFTHAIVTNPPKVGGTYVKCAAEEHSLADYLAAWGRASRLAPGPESTAVIKVSLEQYSQLWPEWGPALGAMLKLWDTLKDSSWSALPGEIVEDVQSFMTEDAKRQIVGTENALRAMDWTTI